MAAAHQIAFSCDKKYNFYYCNLQLFVNSNNVIVTKKIHLKLDLVILINRRGIFVLLETP